MKVLIKITTGNWEAHKKVNGVTEALLCVMKVFMYEFKRAGKKFSITFVVEKGDECEQ